MQGCCRLTRMHSLVIAMFALFAMVSASFAQRQSQVSMVQVTLTSDSETWVSIANTRVPQKFHTQTLALEPGTYEVIGQRKGYMDVRRTLQLRAGMAPVTLRIVCTVTHH